MTKRKRTLTPWSLLLIALVARSQNHAAAPVTAPQALTARPSDGTLLATVQELGSDAVGDPFTGTSRPPYAFTYQVEDPMRDPYAHVTFPAPSGSRVSPPAAKRVDPQAWLELPSAVYNGDTYLPLEIELNGDRRIDHVFIYWDPGECKASDGSPEHGGVFTEPHTDCTIYINAYLARPQGGYLALPRWSLGYQIPDGGDARVLRNLEFRAADLDGDRRDEIMIFGSILGGRTVRTIGFEADDNTFRELGRFSYPSDELKVFGAGGEELADVNGDGLLDLVELPQKQVKGVTIWQILVHLGDGTGGFGPMIVQDTPWVVLRKSGEQFGNYVKTEKFGDVNGDQRTDVVLIDPADDGSGPKMRVCTALSSSADPAVFAATPFVFPSCTPTPFPATYVKNVTDDVNERYFVMNLNSDGMADVVRFARGPEDRRDGQHYTIANPIISQGDGKFFVWPDSQTELLWDYMRPAGYDARWWLTLFGVPPQYTITNRPEFSWIINDVDGDGRQDLTSLVHSGGDKDGVGATLTIMTLRSVHVTTVPSSPFELRVQPTDIPYPWVGLAAGGPSFASQAIGELNGDGRPDVIVWSRTDKTGDIHTCKGAVCRDQVPLTPLIWLGAHGTPAAGMPALGELVDVDVNGDGIPDKVHLADRRPGVRTETWIRSIDSRGDPQFAPAVIDSADLGVATAEPGDFRVGDLDGDGREDLMRAQFEYSPYLTSKYSVVFYALRSQGDGHYRSSTFRAPIDTAASDLGRWLVLDADGDGRADFVYLARAGSCATPLAFLSSGDGTFSTPIGDATVKACGVSSAGWKVASLDGNNRGDVVGVWTHAGSLTITAFRATGAGRFAATRSTIDGTPNHVPERWSAIDGNGDGVTDLADTVITAKPSGMHDVSIELLTGFGDGTFARSTPLTSIDHPSGNALAWLASDFNGDDRTDFYFLEYAAGATDVTRYRAENGASGTVFTSEGVQRYPGFPYASYGDFTALDTDGDSWGDLELLWTIDGKTIQGQNLRWAPGLPLLTAERLPAGGTLLPEYAPVRTATTLNNGSDCRLAPHAAGWIVSRLTVDPDVAGGASYTKTYAYDCPGFSRAEALSLGFRTVTERRPALANQPARTITTQVEITPECHARPSQVTVSDGLGNQRVDAYELQLGLGDPPYQCDPIGDRVTVTDSRGGTRTTHASVELDEFGDPAWQLDEGEVGVADNERSVHTVRGHHDDSFTVYPVSEAVVGGIKTGPELRLTQYDVDGAGRVTAVRVREDRAGTPDGSDRSGFVAAQLGYDAHGNVNTVVDRDGNTTTIAYDPYYQALPVEIRHPEKLTERIAYWGNGYGLPWYAVDFNGIAQNTTTYDALGRPTSRTTARGGITVIGYADYRTPYVDRAGRPAAINAVVATTVYDDLGRAIYDDVTLDGLGRSIRRARKGNASRIYLREHTYTDDRDAPYTESVWYDDGTSPVAPRQYHYDLAGRLARIQNSDGTSRTLTYLARSEEVADELGHTTTATLDAYGDPVDVFEGGGHVRYDRDGLGRIRSVTDPALHVTAFTWDALDRKIVQRDPDLGTWVYDYTPSGRLAKVTDAKGQQTRFTYDGLGRLRTRANADRTLTWTYDEPTHGVAPLGRLTSTSDDSVAATCPTRSQYDYDALGGVTRETRCIDGDRETLHRSYDSLGRLAAVDYPDGEHVPVTYDDSGRLSAVGTLQTGMLYAPDGRLTWAQNADGTLDIGTYEPFGRGLANYRVQRARDERNVLDETWTYQPDGLVSRDDLLTEVSGRRISNYGYDTLHRAAVVSGPLAETFTYNPDGTLARSTMAGAYDYTCRPGATWCPVHAPSRTDGYELGYDENGNLATQQLAGGKLDYRRLTWNADNRVTQIELWDPKLAAWRSTQLELDEQGDEVRKTTSTTTTKYFFPEVELEGKTLVKTYLAGGRPVARFDGTHLQFLHSDRLGSLRVVTENGFTVPTTDLDYFANGRVARGAPASGDRGLTGERHLGDSALDPRLGLIHLGARLLDPELGILESADTELPDLRLRSLNRYAYAFGNPLSYTDHAGYTPCDGSPYCTIVRADPPSRRGFDSPGVTYGGAPAVSLRPTSSGGQRSYVTPIQRRPDYSLSDALARSITGTFGLVGGGLTLFGVHRGIYLVPGITDGLFDFGIIFENAVGPVAGGVEVGFKETEGFYAHPLVLVEGHLGPVEVGGFDGGTFVGVGPHVELPGGYGVEASATVGVGVTGSPRPLIDAIRDSFSETLQALRQYGSGFALSVGLGNYGF